MCEVGRLHIFVHNVYTLVEWCTDHSPKADARTPFAFFPTLVPFSRLSSIYSDLPLGEEATPELFSESTKVTDTKSMA